MTTYTDLATRWIVTIEVTNVPPDFRIACIWTITHPETGESRSRYVALFAPEPDVTAWVRQAPLPKDGVEPAPFLHQAYPELAHGAELPEGPLPRIKLEFATLFKNFDIALPEADVVVRGRGKICQCGWAIWYLFGKDERGEYLDYYSAHRMTGDDHVRLYEDGPRESLPAISIMRVCSEDPEEDAHLEAELQARNKQVEAMLEAKGFG